METDDLKLVPGSPELLEALWLGSEAFEAALGSRLADGLLEFFAWMTPEQRAAYEAKVAADPWWRAYWIVHKAKNIVIGTCGFKGPPDAAGTVEIAYGIVPDYQCRGYATQAAGALTAHALACPDVQTAIAHTLPEPNASTRVLQKCGYRFAGQVIDPEDGPVWRWEKRQD